MDKLRDVFFVIVGVVLLYLILFLIMPVFVDVAATTNTTLNATSNMSMYPGTSNTVIAFPWILYFVPIGIGLFLIVIVLRRD